MPKLSDYPLVGCGYSIPFEHMKEIYWDHTEPFDAEALALDLASWDCTLSPKKKEGTPRIYVRFKDPRDKEYDDWTKADFFILTRLIRVVTVQMANDIHVETEVDRKRRDRFIEVFGKGIDERRMAYCIEEWPNN